MFDINVARMNTKNAKNALYTKEIEERIDREICDASLKAEDYIYINPNTFSSVLGYYIDDRKVCVYLKFIKSHYTQMGYKVKIHTIPLTGDHYATLSWKN